MTREQVLALVQTLGLIDLGEALTYLDEEGQVDARSSRQSMMTTSIDSLTLMPTCLPVLSSMS